MYKVTINSRTKKNLKKIPQKWRNKIFIVLRSFETNPFVGKKLKGELKDYYSYRVWPYRIIYSIHKKQVLVKIENIDHRQKVYQITINI